eukprot:g13321.t1
MALHLRCCFPQPPRRLCLALSWSTSLILSTAAGAGGAGAVGLTVTGTATSASRATSRNKCADDETFCESLNFCLPNDDCSKCFDYPNFNAELRRCTPAPVPFATDFCGAGGLSVSCQNYATLMHNCMNSCGALTAGKNGGGFIHCVTKSDGTCPLTICEQACGCIGTAACAEPCMHHCTAFRDGVLRKPEKFKTRAEVMAFANYCVFGKKTRRRAFLGLLRGHGRRSREGDADSQEEQLEMHCDR